MSLDKNELEVRLRQLVRMTKLIPRPLLALEAELMAAKWPAYRFLSPMSATRLFHSEYVAAYKAYCSTNIDRETGENIKVGTKLRFLTPNAHLTQVWKARQIADNLGLPYPDYLEFAFSFAAERRRAHAPQPNQLGPNDKTREAWCTKLEVFWTPERARLALNRMEPMVQYACEYDRGLPAQRRFREELVESEAASGCALDGFIGRNVVSLRYLRFEDCAPLGADAAAAALERVSREPEARFYPAHSYDQPGPESFLPSCFGLPGIKTNDPVYCACPLKQQCMIARDFVTERVKAETGSDDPVAENSKRKNRQRVAQYRARKKEEAKMHT